MKLMSFVKPEGTASKGAVDGNDVADLGHLAPTLRSAIARGLAMQSGFGIRYHPTHPTVFTRFANTQIGHLRPMIVPNA